MRVPSRLLVLLLVPCVLGNGLLSDWMGAALPYVGNFSLLDLSFPGTHDTMTYDLSLVVADDTNNLPPAVARIMHELPPEIVGPFIHNQAQTQGINVTTQLDNGIRFLDFRIQRTKGPHIGEKEAWYCLHFLESNQPAYTYLQEIKNWMVAHPQEIVVMWLSHHGNTCYTGQQQYPGVTTAQKLAFWAEFEKLFAGMLFNTGVSRANATSVAELVATGQRLVVFMSDHALFSNSSALAYDACVYLDNETNGQNDQNETNGVELALVLYQNMTRHKADLKSRNRFYLMGMASEGPNFQIEAAFKLHYDPFIDKEAVTVACAKQMNVPNMTTWCPPTLQDLGQFGSYYNQIPLDASYNNGWGYPNAIYLDAVDVGGTLRTGTTLIPLVSNATHGMTRYAYAATLVGNNVRLGCAANPSAACSALLSQFEALRAEAPIQRWNDLDHGRLANWPM